MNKPLLMSLTATFLVAGLYGEAVAQAQSRVYRCGNEYTNNPPPGLKGCKPLEGGNVTVIQRVRASDAARVAAAQPSANRVSEDMQRQRDLEARQILEAELRRAEGRQADLLKEYNNGEPEKFGHETRNHQKYLDRVADLRANIERNETDIAGLRRELGRYPESK